MCSSSPRMRPGPVCHQFAIPRDHKSYLSAASRLSPLPSSLTSLPPSMTAKQQGLAKICATIFALILIRCSHSRENSIKPSPKFLLGPCFQTVCLFSFFTVIRFFIQPKSESRRSCFTSRMADSYI